MKNFFLSTITLLCLSILFISWGKVGHKKISEASSLSFNEQMREFQTWVGFLRDHAADADARKGGDPGESPKHYIDLDNYNDFTTKGRIPQTFDSIIAIHGLAIVEDNGILPWATKASFDSLRNCFQRHDFTKAKVFAADLGHYVADGHMPMHITKNYNGQLTGTTGLHSRYETTMIDYYISQITYTGDSITVVSDVNQYIFNYLYTNYPYVDSVLIADNYAKSLGAYSTTAYKTALWAKTKGFTIPLFKRASHALAELIYTAWVQAGSPSLINTTSIESLALTIAELDQNIPNPFSYSSKVVYKLKTTTEVLIQVRDIKGTIVSTLVNETFPAGNYTCEWIPENLPSGLYYMVLNTGKYTQVKKMVYSGRK